ncbi:ABC transporter permease [Streptomyces sp. V3I7]|uniref:ABC transporter permease n=1 Tax=Streptomyces sp. V3I7 TaxID=3042278 RepID=UPI002788D479|nr:ABC transporter permease [Streptomyces sp. V3I7]MDQ0993703.1 NitT/TauT family transport system permease protein [Streptomyces sp. V3I7]
MASTDTKTAAEAAPESAEDAGRGQDGASIGAGLDALEVTATGRPSLRQTFVGKIVPPVTAILVVLVVWQGLISLKVVDDPTKLPSPAAVWHAVEQAWLQGTLLGYIWTSVSRGLLGFFFALLIGTPLGLLVARVKFVRAAIGPILSGLQSLPSVAWVPPAVIWLGLNNSMMYAVILLGAVPSIANGLVSGVDQVSPLFVRAGRTMGATGLKGVRHVTLPAAMPGYVAGLKQGWAFSWRSLMAAEIIANFPDLGVGLGQLLENGRTASDMAMVFEAILLILFVGIAIDLLIFSPLERWVLRSRGLLVRS